ncbi:MAG: succinate dehydrogenase cytochrome b subunit [Bacteroidales bacterium]|nr:succinate dehydrogenase cytochrome b subunit [Bacteroidales bacterium]
MALSSIAKKLIMSISGLFLIVFLLLHMTINLFSVVDSFKGTYGAADGLFQAGCDFMALPIVTVMVPVLAAGFLVHIVYAFILTAGNIRARGGYQRYAGGSKGKAESWASKNMLVLGVVVLGLIAFHLNHFWAEMQLKEFQGHHAENPYLLLNETFKNGWMVVLYVLWFAALGFHLTHGFWSAFQTIGLSNSIWEKRLYCLGKIFVGIIVLGFSVVAVNAFLQANGFIGCATACCGCC